MTLNVLYHDHGLIGPGVRAIIDRRVALLGERLADLSGNNILTIGIHYDLRHDRYHARVTLDLDAERLGSEAFARDRTVALTAAFAGLCRAVRDYSAPVAAA